MDQDLYALLGVVPNADARDIKKAYFQKVREFPPETHAEQFQQIRKAYETLSDPDQRRGYDASRGDAWNTLGQEMAAVMRSASEAMQKEEFDSAARLLEAVVAQRPEAEEARAKLCSCLLNLKEWNRASAAAQDFIAQHPKSVVAHLLKGYADNGAGNLIAARSSFLTVLDLDPDDFRAYRAVVDTWCNEGLPDNALKWLEDVADQPTDRDVRRMVKMEIIALGVHLGRSASGLETLSRDVKDDDERDEFRRFCDRLVTISLGRATGKTPALLKQLRALGVTSDLTALVTTTTVPLGELSENTRAWLARQRKQTDIFFIAGQGTFIDSLIAAGAVLVFGGLVWLLFSSHSVIRTEWAMFLAGVFGAVGLLAGWACVSLARHVRSELGRFTCMSPVWLIEVDLDHAHFRPLAAMKVMGATHQHTYGSYLHTTISLSFGDSNSSLSLSKKSLAEQFLQQIQEAKQRLLDLGHSGLIGAVEGIDLLGPEQRGVSRRVAFFRRRNVVGGLVGAAVGCVALLLGVLTSNTRAENNEFEQALTATASGPRAMREFVEAHPASKHAARAAEALTRRREAFLTELKPLATGLSEALAAHTKPTPFVVKVLVVPTVEVGPMTTTAKGRLVADMPPEVYASSRQRRFEDQLVGRIQAGFDSRFGAGWVSFSSKEAATTALTVRYRLSLSGRAFGLWSEDPDKGSDVLWAEPQADVTAALGSTTVQATVTPAPSVAVHGEVTKNLATKGAASLYPLLVDSVLLKVIDVVGAVVGLTSKQTG